MNFRQGILFALAACTALHADIHLRGVLQRDGKYVVGLWNSHERHASIEWIPVGGNFAGFTVESYDLARDRVRLTKDDLILEASPTAPVRIAPELLVASKIVVQDGRRLCAVHHEPLIIQPGFVARSDVLEYLGGTDLETHMQSRPEFPNRFGGGVARTPRFFFTVEVRKEFCMACEKALFVRTASRR